MFLNKKGFTLIEILVVVVIVGILAAVVIPRVTTSAATAKENTCDADIVNINTAIELYYFNGGSWASQDLSEMVPTTTYDYFPDGLPPCPVSGSSYEMDTTTHRVYETGTHDHTP